MSSADMLSMLWLPGIAVAGYLAVSFICLRVMSRQNNQDVTMPDKEEFRLAFERAIQWMIDNEEDTFVNNWYLWIFVREAAQSTKNKNLLAILENLRKIKRQQGGKRDVWHMVENPGEDFIYNPDEFGALYHYAQAIIYGVTGKKEAGESEFIRCQLKPDYSDAETAKDIRSSCLTHQVLGLHFIQTGGYCGDPQQYDLLMANLQGQMRELLLLDPRVGDVYLQRVLMLVWTGARDQVKPAWFRRVLERQRPDGGWLPFHNLGWLAPGLRIGMGLGLIRMKRDKTTFHTTAQGLLLTALMSMDADGAQ